MKGAGRNPLSDLDRGRECYSRRAWEDAYCALARADAASPLAVEDLERLAWSASLTARDDESLASLERLHQLRLEAGDDLSAARAAFWIGFRLVGFGEMARASGWFARAHRLVEGADPDCALRGYLMLPEIIRSVMSGQLEAAEVAAQQALEIAERCGDRDLIPFVRHLQGRILLQQGRMDGGLALFDEAMVAVTADDLSPVIVGIIYCSVISCCQKVYDLNRAREWTSALEQWCQAQPQLVTFTSSCLVHRAEIMQLGGDWPESIEAARRAAERFTRPSERHAAANAFYQQAEIHRLRGEFTAAEEAFRRASELGREPQPGLALLRLAQQRQDAAASAIRRVIGIATDPFQRAGLLPAYVEIMLGVGALDEARTGCQELEQFAASISSDVLSAMAAHARGAIALTEGDARRAVEPLRRAFQAWQQMGAPYIAARIRVLLARAYRALGDNDATVLELDAARGVFERLGAAPDLERLEAQVDGAEPSRPHGLTSREMQVLRLVASGKTNKAIAKELFLSEKTVDRHVSNIFTKVNVQTRAAATAYAYEHGLI